MRYGSDRSDSLLPAAAGAAAGIGADRAVMALKSAKSRSNWALGVAVGVTALAAVSASDLNNDQGLASTTVSQASALTFTSAGATGAEVAALRSIVVQQGYILQKIAYDASLFSFNGAPAAPNTTNPAVASGAIGAITQTTTVQSNNNGAFILALVVLAVLAIVMLD